MFRLKLKKKKKVLSCKSKDYVLFFTWLNKGNVAVAKKDSMFYMCVFLFHMLAGKLMKNTASCY